METLKLKDIAPYLPYGTNVYFEGKLENLYGLKADMAEISIRRYPYISKVLLNQIKPVLNPLSDLTREIEVNGEIINPLYEIMSDSWIVGKLNYIKREHSIIIKDIECIQDLIIYTTKPHVNMWWVTQKLIEMHFDINNLIEKGLAINKNTL